MGWTVLYIAFGVVALWLLGEVLLQYKARLRWRLVAFFGFLGVVVGVVLPSVPVIAVGTLAFAVGQTFVTLSFRRGFTTGWALGGKAGGGSRQREGQEMRPLAPVAEDAPPEGAPPQEGFEPGAAPSAPPPPAAAPDAGGYPESYDGQSYEGRPYQEQPYEGQQEQPYEGQQAEPGRGGYQEEIYAEASGYQPTAGYPDGYAQPYADPGPYGGAPSSPPPAGTPAEPYAAGYDAYADPYLAGSAGPGGDPAAGGPGPYPDYATQSYPADYPAAAPYPTQGAPGDFGATTQWSGAAPGYGEYQDTPPGGVWVPPQRDATPGAPGYGVPQPEAGPYPQAQAEPQPNAYDHDASGQGYYFDQGPRY